DHRNDAERVPLLHEPVTWSFRLNRQAVKHARLANREIADVDHFLHFAFAFGDDLTSLERDKLAELVLQIAQRVTKTANSFTTHRAWRNATFRNRFLGAFYRLVIIFVGCSKHTC